MRHKKSLHKLKIKKRFWLFLFIILFIIILADHQIRPLIKSIALNRARVTSTQVINETVLEEVSRLDIDYSSITTLERDEKGRIVAINANMKKINILKSAVTISIQKKILHMPKKDLQIPVGTLTGTELLNGKGPSITMEVTLSGSVLTNFRSVFESAGINQTKHQMYLDICAEVFALIPGYPATTAINTSVLIAESIFMGDVPTFYTDVSG